MMKRLGRIKAKPPVKAPSTPARTRFAPSPTGSIHLGSLRTAAFNYLLAKATGGQFLLRLEDTDQKRLVPGAEENIYTTLKWAGLDADESPQVGGPHGPYRQSERRDIYSKYTEQLLKEGKAYRCFCSHERLDSLAASARNMLSTASYDRKCSHLSAQESDSRKHEPHVVRFKSPTRSDGSEAPAYPEFTDLLHGKLNIQPQVNPASVRYDDFVLVKSDGLPTYHMANVVDDHLMEITHVIRGEEWLPSTPKHVALYNSFNWQPPAFIHIPLLVDQGGKKLSKRKAAIGALEFQQEYLPEAFLNFVVLLGWSPAKAMSNVSRSEFMTREQLVQLFSLEGLTKGNVQVDMQKLEYFSQRHFRQALETPHALVGLCQFGDLTETETLRLLSILQKHVSSPAEFRQKVETTLATPAPVHLSPSEKELVDQAAEEIASGAPLSGPKKQVLPLLRRILVGGHPGCSIQEIVAILGTKQSLERLNSCTY